MDGLWKSLTEEKEKVPQKHGLFRTSLKAPCGSSGK